MGHGVFQWDTMFEIKNNSRCMVPIQKSVRTLRSMRTLELGEEVDEPALRYKGDREGKQGGRGNAYSPYQSGIPIIGIEKR